MGLAKEYAFNGYEFQGENSRPIDEDTVEIGRHEHISHESEHGQESEQQHEHEHERERGHSHDDDRHEKHHHEHHEHVHLHHTKSISHHPKKPGFSAGSGLRSIAQGSADQASSAVNNQVRKIYFQIDFIEKKKVFYCYVYPISMEIYSMPQQNKQHSLHKIHLHRYGERTILILLFIGFDLLQFHALKNIHMCFFSVCVVFHHFQAASQAAATAQVIIFFFVFIHLLFFLIWISVKENSNRKYINILKYTLTFCAFK